MKNKTIIWAAIVGTTVSMLTACKLDMPVENMVTTTGKSRCCDRPTREPTN